MSVARDGQFHFTPLLRVVAALFVVAMASACGDTTGPKTPGEETLDLSLLFAPPTTAEIAAVLDSWAGREVVAEEVQELAHAILPYGTQGMRVRIVSHRVGDIVHVGAIATPVGADTASLPVLVYSHAGDRGENLDFLLPGLPPILGDFIDHFVLVVPSFRSENLVFGGVTYESGGDPSLWDGDVDDALALMEVAFQTVPEADPARVGVIGSSRGATVGMLMAIRDPRIDQVVEFFGPTDFFGPFAREVVEDALRGTLLELPGFSFLDQAFIQPLKNGQTTIAAMREELLRRSPVYFADRLPDVQIHHGTADKIVPFGEAQRLIDVMLGLGRTGPGFEFFIYEGGAHGILTMPESLPRTQAFLSRLLEAD